MSRVVPVPDVSLWHVIYRGKVLASGDLSAVLLAYYKIPADKRVKTSLRAARLRKEKP